MRWVVGAFVTALFLMAAWAAGAPVAVLRATRGGVGIIPGDCADTLGALAGVVRREQGAACVARVAATREGHAAMTWLLEVARDPRVEVEVRLGLLAVPFSWAPVGPTLAERRAALAARADADAAHRAALLEGMSDARWPRALRARALDGLEAVPGRIGTVDAWLRAAAIPLLRERAVLALAELDPAWEDIAAEVVAARGARAVRCGSQGAAAGAAPVGADAAGAGAVDAAAAWLAEVEGASRAMRLAELLAPLGVVPGPACEEGDLAAALAGVPAPGTVAPLAGALGARADVPVRVWVEAGGARHLQVGDGVARRIAAGEPNREGALPSGVVEEVSPAPVAPTLRGGVAGGPPPAP